MYLYSRLDCCKFLRMYNCHIATQFAGLVCILFFQSCSELVYMNTVVRLPILEQLGRLRRSGYCTAWLTIGAARTRGSGSRPRSWSSRLATRVRAVAPVRIHGLGVRLQI